MATDYKKITKEDPQFLEFMTIVSVGLVLNMPDFKPLLSLMYSFYQQDLSPEQTAALIVNITRQNKADGV